MYNRVHMFGTHINATYNLFTEYLALDKRNNHSGPSSFAEFLEPSSDTSVVGDCYPSREMPIDEGASCRKESSNKVTEVCLDEEVINRVFLELTATCGLTWTTFLADLGYNSRKLLKLTVDQRDIYFNLYLQYWLETVTQLGFNPTVYLYRAVVQTQDKNLVDKFKRLFNNSDSLCSPSDQEFETIKRNLLQIDLSTQKDELLEIKAYLHNTKKEKFGKKVIEEIKTGIDLMQKLKEKCLVNEDNFDFLKSILHFLKRDDLIEKITALETPVFVFKRETLHDKRNVSPCSTDPDSPNSYHKPLEDLDSKFLHSTRIIENSISAKIKEIEQTDCRTKELTTASESCHQKKKKCEKERMQIEAKIKKLQSDANDLQSKEASLESEISSLDEEIKDVKKLHKKQTSELDLYKNTLEEETKTQKELKKKQTLEEEKKLQLHKQKQREYENRGQTLENENKKQSQQKKELENQRRICRDIEIQNCPPIERDCPFDDEDKPAKTVSRYESHISRDENTQKDEEAAQVVPQCASSEEARARPLSLDVNVDPMILVMAAEENKDELESFKADVLLAVPHSVTRSSIQEIVIESFIDEQFLSKTDNQIQKAVLLFILVSGGFAKRCWPDISKMKNLTAALYDQQPLVVPVIIKANVKPPMGLNSAHSLSFYRRDSYYKEALSKLLGQLKK
ncbi:Hypothetical predicted protein [Mytilus galloprovincialis]|uniref:DED domain-containing protein n=1 Tax=Mytilus galloprovincialis TaxID=29158 RepID=A0A8B6BWJ6_MYTGA|nr:Hypothetical predicted protein [Mytilus galloprovincialis]